MNDIPKTKPIDMSDPAENIPESAPPERKRRGLSQWGFSRVEERALYILIGLVILGGAARYWRNHQFAQRIEIWSAAVDSAASEKPAAVPEIPAAININTASAAELTSLPGIGPVRAQAIVDFRNKRGRFSKPADLLDVKGLGPKTLANITPYLHFGDPPSPAGGDSILSGEKQPLR